MSALSNHRPGASPIRRSGRARAAAAHAVSLTLALGLLAACASAPPSSGQSLSSYDGLARTKARRTQVSARADSAMLMGARTVRIEPVTFADDARSNATPAQRGLIANAIERTLCHDLRTRFEIVTAPDTANLTVRTVVTRVKPTDAGAAALSVAVSMVIPAPRLPLGLGGFAAEAEALKPEGGQAAAMTWSRNADLFSGKRVSSVGDAYDLSTRFAHDLSTLLAKEKDRSLPRLSQSSKPVSSTCAIYGRSPGLSGTVAGLLGAPPEWTDGHRPGR